MSVLCLFLGIVVHPESQLGVELLQQSQSVLDLSQELMINKVILCRFRWWKTLICVVCLNCLTSTKLYCCLVLIDYICYKSIEPIVPLKVVLNATISSI